MTRGRPPKTWEQLRAAGAKPCVWQKRQRETLDAANPATVQAVQRFIAAMKHEQASFRSKRIDGITVVQSDAEPNIFETIMSYVKRMRATNEFPRSRRLATRFIRDLETLAARGYYFDMQACENTQLWLDTFGIEDSEYTDADLFVLANLVSWKRPDGSFRFRKNWSELSQRQGKVILDGMKLLSRV